jgi:aryl-alcohol dehydrogenase-like predicted oxidoreductase
MQIALGTVQFGLAYGIAGSGAPVPPAEARTILEFASQSGVRMLDTAPVYGDIEERLAALASGLEFEVVSKVPPVPAALDGSELAAWVRASIEQSRARLGDSLRTILFHRADDLRGSRARTLWDAAARTTSGSMRLGTSCYGPAELNELMTEFGIEVAQLPANAFDQRVADAVGAGRLRGVDLHVRSAFLQGLLLMPENDIDKRLPAAAAPMRRWRQWCAERGLSPLQAALAVVKATPGVSHVVVGVESCSQLEQILKAWQAATPMPGPELSCADPAVIDPRTWKAA